MTKLAKLRLRELRSWRIWESLTHYANAQDDRSKTAAHEQYFQTLLGHCMDWIGGDREDIAECGDMKDGTPLERSGDSVSVRHQASAGLAVGS